ncbi:MAG: hypothetical protein K2M80_00345 [Muribaculaceae bacterium]|nr:hypothetical protein [Muribaculaceae bacterium]
MNIHDQLRSIYQLEGLYELLKNNDLQQSKVAEINHLIDEMLIEVSRARNLCIPSENSCEDSLVVEHETQIEPQQPDFDETEADEAKIADNAIFEEEADADTGEGIDKKESYDIDEDIVAETSKEMLSYSDLEPNTVNDSDSVSDEVKDVEEEIGVETIEPEHTAEEDVNDIPSLDINIDASDTSYSKKACPTANLNSSALKFKARNDVKSAFTLNDKFRFSRELFGNSQAQYNDALNMINAMHSFDEAEDYFYNDLEWNAENPDVEDFMHIVKSILG